MNEHEVMDAKQCAEFIGLSRYTLAALVRRTEKPLPCHRPGGANGKAKFIRAEVLEWLRQQ